MARDPDPLPQGWLPVDGVARAQLTTRLVMELGRDSDLLGRLSHVVAVDQASETLVVEMRRWPAPYALVRLNWQALDDRPWFVKLLFPRRGGPEFQPLNRLADLPRL